MSRWQWLSLAALTAVALALRFWRLGDMPLVADEAYYLLWAGRPAAAYFDHPAGIAVLLRISVLLGGTSELGVRWLNALLSTACVPLAYAVGRRYVSAAGGMMAAAAAALAPVYIVTGRVAYPDALQNCLFLTTLLAAWPLWRREAVASRPALRTGRGRARTSADSLSPRLSAFIRIPFSPAVATRLAWASALRTGRGQARTSADFSPPRLSAFIRVPFSSAVATRPARASALKMLPFVVATFLAWPPGQAVAPKCIKRLKPLLRRFSSAVALGLSAGLFLNVKLTSLFAVGGLALGLLLWRRERLRDPDLWLAAGIAAACMIPYLLWNSEHGWTSLRLAWEQGGGFGAATPGLLGRMAHAWRYLSPPAALLACLAALAATWWFVTANRYHMLTDSRDAARLYPLGPRVLALVAVCQLAPLLLSAADSPRNLGMGLLALWPLAGLIKVRGQEPGAREQGLGTRGQEPGASGQESGVSGQQSAVSGQPFAIALCLVLGLYAVGTVAGLLGPTTLPRSSAADKVRADCAGWPEFGRAFDPPPGNLVFAVDYSIAGQIAYYSGRPVYSAAGQFRIWGIPEADEWTVLAQGYLPPEVITAPLQAGFETVIGPTVRPVGPVGAGKYVYVWQAAGRRVSTDQMVEALDYLRLTQR